MQHSTISAYFAVGTLLSTATAMPDDTVSTGTIRKLRSDERQELSAHLLRLGPHERRMRFCGVAGDDSIRRYARQDFGLRSAALGYFVKGVLRGAAELIVPNGASWHMPAEAALSVEAEHRGRGIGTQLTQRLIVLARNRGVSAIHVYCLPENEAMRRIAEKLGAELEFGGEPIKGRIDVRWPTYITLVEEALIDVETAMQLVFDPGPVVGSESAHENGD